MTTASSEDIDFDFSQLDDTLISDNQKQNLIDYINQIKSQKRSINDEFNQFKLSTGSIKIENFRHCYFAKLLFHIFNFHKTNERMKFCCVFLSIFFLFAICILFHMN